MLWFVVGMGSSLLLTYLSACQAAEANRGDRSRTPDERPDLTGFFLKPPLHALAIREISLPTLLVLTSQHIAAE